MKAAVLTTIQGATLSVRRLQARLAENGMRFIAIGDRKTPPDAWAEGSDLISIEAQLAFDLLLPRALPENHYARKNVGYLVAASAGASSIFDTDDDNSPLTHWQSRELQCSAQEIRARGWVNVYSCFSSASIWPRGFPLEEIRQANPPHRCPEEPGEFECPVQQTLVNGSPDVDAIWRLLFDRDFHFDAGPSILLAPGAWCPFNSQSTWWFPAAYRLMYLPSHVSFRMTDIWRSFVAQRCLWELGRGVAFHAADMLQDRNPHELIKDFEQEVPGYLSNNRIRRCLEALSLSSKPDGVGDNLARCYDALVRAGIVPTNEIPLVELWLRDFERLGHREAPSPGSDAP